MKIYQITDYLEKIAPLEYQEAYDNSGLIIGNKNENISRILITLDCTEEVIEEAILNKCELIISHHPIIFSDIKKLNYNHYTERVIVKAIRNNIAIYACHTNLDNVIKGVNGRIADKLNLTNRVVLSHKKNILRQLVVYCPLNKSEELKEALFHAGAGKLGDYDCCSFSSEGLGTFHPKEKSNPYIGEKGEIHYEKETRIEVVYHTKDENNILSAMRTIHPYEEIAHQIYIIPNTNKSIGSGLIGELTESVASIEFLRELKKVMNTKCIKHTAITCDNIKYVAVCGGSGAFLIEEAKKHKADIFITSDIKYHQFFDADKKIIIADIGHYESEQYTKDLIYDFLVKKFTKFAILLSKVNTNPINYL